MAYGLDAGGEPSPGCRHLAEWPSDEVASKARAKGADQVLCTRWADQAATARAKAADEVATAGAWGKRRRPQVTA